MDLKRDTFTSNETRPSTTIDNGKDALKGTETRSSPAVSILDIQDTTSLESPITLPIELNLLNGHFIK